MTSQPDKLFRDKLENFQRPAPVGAWDKIERNLPTPAYKLVWVRAAAGIALLAAVTVILWPSGKPETKIATTVTEQPVTKSTTSKDIIKKENKAITPNTKPFVSAKAPNNILLAKTKKEIPAQQQTNTKQDSVIIAPVPQQLIVEVALPVEHELPAKTIVYTANEVNAKFLKKKVPSEATPEAKEASGIQKLIGLAYAAKNSEATLGDLRQKKDDLLALSFSKKKSGN